MIQNMKNIESKFRIDLEYFRQDLVNTRRFKGKKFEDFGNFSKSALSSRYEIFQVLQIKI